MLDFDLARHSDIGRGIDTQNNRINKISLVILCIVAQCTLKIEL